MASFSNDVDILKYEPMLFGQLHLPWQVIAEGTGGTLSGTTFTATGADFISAGLCAGGVIYLASENKVLDGAFEIVSVDSATQLSVSVLRSDSQADAVAPPVASDVCFRISTFAPQANEVGFQLTEYFGIRPGNPSSDYGIEDILDTSVLRQASVFAVLACVYAMLAGKAQDDNFWKKSLYYQKLFNKAKQRTRLSIDLGSDGVVDVTQIGSSAKLVRD
jgi:hypothetical protein